jgi:hypothetical protein
MDKEQEAQYFEEELDGLDSSIIRSKSDNYMTVYLSLICKMLVALLRR